MDTLSDNEKVERGRKAELLMADPVMLDAFDKVRQDLLEALAVCPARDVEGLQLAQAQIKVIDKTAMALHDFIAIGKSAQTDIEREIKRNEEERIRLEREAEGYVARGYSRLRSLAGRQ